MFRKKTSLSVLFLCALLSLALSASADPALFLADLHLTTDTAAFGGTLESIRREAGACGPVIFLGDNTNNGRSAEHTAFLGFLGSMKPDTEILVIPGNHDLCGETSPEIFRARYHAFGWDQAFAADDESLSYAVLLDGVCYLMLDTNLYDPAQRMTLRGAISPSVLRFTGDVLTGLPESTPVIACGHHPLLPLEGETDLTENTSALVSLLERHGVTLWVSGHRHSNYTLASSVLRQVGVGTPGGYPAWAGLLEKSDTWHYRVRSLIEKEPALLEQRRNEALALGRTMAEGSLKGTVSEGDEEAVSWFAEAFLSELEGTLSERRGEFLSRSGCEAWRRAEVRAVTRKWILGLLEHESEDVRDLTVPMRAR